MTANGFIRAFIGALVLWIVGGFLLFPHAPIKECKQPNPATYCGKGGVASSQAEYQRFQVWENGVITGLFLLVPLSLWQSRLAAGGDKKAIADVKLWNALSYRSLWSVRWFTGTFFLVQSVAGAFGASQWR